MNKFTKFLVDMAMLIITGMIAYMATESFTWMVGAQVVVGVYGMWCRRQGALALQRMAAKRVKALMASMEELQRRTR